jgi:HEAT repeat protein
MERDNGDSHVSEPIDVWQMLEEIPAEPPDSAAMRHQFDAAVRAERLAMRWRYARWPLAGMAAAAVLVLGIAIGRATIAAPPPDPALTELRAELHDMRQMVTLSLLQQQSATERLKGVSFTSQIDRPGSEIVAALLDTLMHDPNVNVRLASIDALRRFAGRADVQRATLDALTTQTSPMVQIALIDMMVELNDREAVAPLRRLSRDDMVNEAVRERAAWGLQRIG